MTSLGNRRARRSFSVLLVTAVSAAGLTAVAAAGPAGAVATHTAAHRQAAAPAGDETTAAQNNLRDGWDPNEPALTQAAVEGGQFGQVFKAPVDGQVYAQPLVVGNTVIVATENDSVYGLDAKTGALQWKTSLGKAYHITSCDDLTPDIGITSTPVYDPNTQGGPVPRPVQGHLARRLGQPLAGSPDLRHRCRVNPRSVPVQPALSNHSGSYHDVTSHMTIGHIPVTGVLILLQDAIMTKGGAAFPLGVAHSLCRA